MSTSAQQHVIEVKRGGYAQYFIYMALLTLFATINSLITIPTPYLYYVLMAVVLVAVISMNKLQAIVFPKILIRADKEGIWTSKLNLVAWNNVKDIRLEKTNYSTKSSGSITQLILESTDERKSVFWCEFLNTDSSLLYSSLNKYWLKYK